LAFFFLSWTKYQQATSGKILTSNKQQATSGKTPGPVPDRAGPKDREQQALVYIRYILYNKDLLN